MPRTKRRHLGTFAIGYEAVDLYATEDTGGHCFQPNGDNGERGFIEVGIGHSYWRQVLAVLLHESAEYLLVRDRLAFEATLNLSGDTSDRLFVLNHSQFSELCARQADFLAKASPAMEAAWRKQPKRK